MSIINFNKARRKLQKKHSPKIDVEEKKLKNEDYQLAKFYSQWYDNHVVGKGADGKWQYKNM